MENGQQQGIHKENTILVFTNMYDHSRGMQQTRKLTEDEKKFFSRIRKISYANSPKYKRKLHALERKISAGPNLQAKKEYEHNLMQFGARTQISRQMIKDIAKGRDCDIITDGDLVYLDSRIPQTREESTPCTEGDTDMARQKFEVTLGNGTKVWLTGKTISEAFNNGLKKYSGQPQEVPDRRSFEDYVTDWLDTYKARKLKPTTLKGYMTMLHSHILPAFGKRLMDDITVKDIQEFLNQRQHLSAKYLKDMKIFIGSVFRDAQEDHVVTENPAVSRRITIPSTKKTVREALTIEQFRNVLGNLYRLPIRSRRMIALMMLTGARRGEVLGFQWEDIDWNAGLIHIQRNVTYPKNQPLVGTTKSKNGVRTIPLLKELSALLDYTNETGYIIADKENDEPISMMAYRRMWQSIEATIELYGATAHIFRHTYLTLVEGTGTDVKTLQAIAGHGDIQVTMNRYVHPQTENIVKAGQSLERLLG